MAQQPNNQVMQLWRDQSQLLERTPEIVAQHVQQIGEYLGALHERAEGDSELQALINSAWGKVQGLQTLVAGQTSVLASAGVIIPALKIQRDELALEMAQLLEKLGLAAGQSPVDGMLTNLYNSWRESLDDSDIISDGQDELLEVMTDDMLNAWNWPMMLNGRWVLRAIRGIEDMPEESAALFQAFLDSLGGGS